MALPACVLFPGSGEGDADSEDADRGGTVTIGSPVPMGSDGSSASASDFGAPGANPPTISTPIGSPGATDAGPTGSTAADDPWAAFTRVAEAPAGCEVFVADDPLATYGPLATRPCANGRSGCSEVIWEGVLPAAGESLGGPAWEARSVLDSDGAATHVILTRHWEQSILLNAASESVVYELSEGRAVAALRNGVPGRRDAIDSACQMRVVGAGDRLWVVLEQDDEVRVGHAPLDSPSGLTPTAVEVPADVMNGTVVAGEGYLGMESSDGLIVRVGDDFDVASFYAPDARVWLAGAAGSRLLAHTRQDSSLQRDYYLVDAEGIFERVLTAVRSAGGSPTSLAWVESASGSPRLHVAAIEGSAGVDVAGASDVAIVDGDQAVGNTAGAIGDLLVGDSAVAMSLGESFALTVPTAIVTGLDGSVRASVQLSTQPYSEASPLQALLPGHLWVSAGYERDGRFEALQCWGY